MILEARDKGKRRPTFVSEVHRLVRRIPHGRIATYGQIAASLGRPRAARAVGWAMRHCPRGVPWHRVVNAHGGISRRPNAGSMLTQRLLLEQEGVRVRRGRVSLVHYAWRALGRAGGVHRAIRRQSGPAQTCDSR